MSITRTSAATHTSEPPLLEPKLLARLARMEVVTRKVFRGRMKGERRSHRKGQSVEFADFRSYVPGDDTRFIDWNTYARLDRLFLKLFLEEEDLHFYALLDASPSMDFGSPSKLRYAKQLAAALGFIGLARADRIKVETLGTPLGRPATALRGRANLWRLIEQLGAIRPDASEAVSLAKGVKNFCLRNTGAGVVVLVSDLLDKSGYEDAIRMLVAQRMDVYVIHVLSPVEIDPDVQGDLRLVDCEDGDVAEITVSAPLLKRYRAGLARFIDGARSFCTQRGVRYVLARTDVPIEQLVLNYLKRQGLVR